MMIHWCELCNNAPSEGVLEVVDKKTQEKLFMRCCTSCVENIDESDWIDNAI